MTEPGLTESVRSYWEQEPCGSSQGITGGCEPGSAEWFARIEQHRYRAEPMIHAVAEFARHHGARVLEVGVGAGTDHLQWARSGCECHGVDLTDAAIETTRAHLALHGFSSDLQRINAESLPFPDDHFDIVYSWGVIHHAKDPARIMAEIHRVLRPGGQFIGMLYNRHSIVSWVLWLKHALLAGRPFRSLRDVLAQHLESPGTKGYTVREMRGLLAAFGRCELRPWLTVYDRTGVPSWISRFFQPEMGWFISFRARK